MTKKLKQGFFKVAPFNKYVPLTGELYAVEKDNVFNIYKGNTVLATYSGASHGLGKVLSVFNTEYVVYEDGARNINCVDTNGTVTRLISGIAQERTVICYNNVICVITRVDYVITIKKYIIVGTIQSPFVEQLDGEETITVPYYNDAMTVAGYKWSCMASVTEDAETYYIYDVFYRSGGDTEKYCVRVTFQAESLYNLTLTHEVLNSNIQDNIHGTLMQANTGYYFRTPSEYYANIHAAIGTGTNNTIDVYDNTDTLLYSYTITGTTYGANYAGCVQVFFEPNAGGDAYVVMCSASTNIGSPQLTIRTYHLSAGTATLLNTYTSGAINVVSAHYQGSSFFQWVGQFCGYGFGSNGYSQYSANITSDGITASGANYVNTTSSPSYEFGNMIKMII